MNTFDDKKIDNLRSESQTVGTWSDSSFVTTAAPETIPAKWIFVFFDLPSTEFTRRVSLHRQFRKVGLAMHSQSVYFMPYSRRAYKSVNGIDEHLMVIRSDIEIDKSVVLVGLYQKLVESLFLEIENKVEELADAKADSDNTRGYTKRYKKMLERLEDLTSVVKYVPSDSYIQRIKLLEYMVGEINERAPGMGVS